MLKYVLNIFFFCFLISCKQEPKEKEMETLVDFSLAHEYYLKNVTHAVEEIDSLMLYKSSDSVSKKIFKNLRLSFKKAEPYISYLKPSVGHRINGPALPILAEDTGKILMPYGLQKIEESIFEGEGEKVYQEELRITKGLLQNLQKYIVKRPLNEQRFFIATHEQLLRVVSHGISGFDTPVSHFGINESAVSLNSLKEVYKLSIQSVVFTKNKELDVDFINTIDKAVAYIRNNPDFDTFDRYTFIRDYFNPITRNWVAVRKETGIWEGADNKVFNFDAPTFFETNTFNVNHFLPVVNKKQLKDQIALGKKLYKDKNLSLSKKMACITCHDPNKGYADGLKQNLDNSGNPLQRNSPTLLNAIYQKAFFWDGRSPTLDDQISAVFSNTLEFDSKVHSFSTEILKDSSYVKIFKDVYGKIPTKNIEIIRAISSYVATLQSFNSKFDRNIRAEIDTYTQEEKDGMNLFMGKALCATCHFMPLTNGTVPPFFDETEKEVIGVAKTSNNKEIDTDTGFYFMYEEPLHKGMFKTPTVRNVALTAPYMHNGAYNTLEQVIDFYNKGGGGGLGFDVPHQTLPFDELSLTVKEQESLVAFMKTLTDASVATY
ncbi:cytochrome-c peroxidase [Cellulophaga baltica]|uniref:cytochrome-c peroxidase n=1 Tax=Cellulophaga TaxID=104264 RepID=UPI001C078916|nr:MULTISPECIES: cytochrome c peroxidase [Cellulophaga]MBU2996157.1 cytochrome-c peroxidase [Cellulophaga baltica]MDO6767552.1 cytochrome c peroxidase [Cellulophaga sp. 1_MG-2023]